MCLGIPGQIVAVVDEGRQMAMADVSGVRREVSIACVADRPLASLLGEWVLIHVGFAMAVIDEAEAQETLEALKSLGEAQETLEQMAAGAKTLEEAS